MRTRHDSRRIVFLSSEGVYYTDDGYQIQQISANVPTYCEREGIMPHKFRPDKTALRKWCPLLGLHALCAVCGYSRIYIAHDKRQRK